MIAVSVTREIPSAIVGNPESGLFKNPEVFHRVLLKL
jgi:hypothetical protein